ncbi:hypothetical protein [Streptomyces atratus]|uniref:hypothetical protein n=1 Tax=Streptomyces atratus TaxID=1893 RepID=UPI003402352A
MKLAGEMHSSGMRVTLVVHEHKRLGIEPAMPAEELKASDVGQSFSVTGGPKGSHNLSGTVFTMLAAMSDMKREYIRDRTLEGHEPARNRSKSIGGVRFTHADLLSMARRLRDEVMSLRDEEMPARHRPANRHHHGREEGTAPLGICPPDAPRSDRLQPGLDCVVTPISSHRYPAHDQPVPVCFRSKDRLTRQRLSHG